MGAQLLVSLGTSVAQSLQYRPVGSSSMSSGAGRCHPGPIPRLRDPWSSLCGSPASHTSANTSGGEHGPLNVCFWTEDQTGDAGQQQHGAVRGEAPLPRPAAPGLWMCSPPGGFKTSHFMYGASAPGSPGVSVPLGTCGFETSSWRAQHSAQWAAPLPHMHEVEGG